MSAKWKVDLSEFERGMKKLSKVTQGEILHDTLDAGARVVQANAMINIEQTFSENSTGAMANSVIVQFEGSGKKQTAKIGPTVVYGRIQELGGWIRPVIAKMLHWVEDGIDIFAKAVYIPARPFLRPAVDGHESEIVGAMASVLAAAIGQTLGGQLPKMTKVIKPPKPPKEVTSWGNDEFQGRRDE